MSKRPKKRNKPYQGTDASPTGPTVRRYTAVERSPFGQWWFDHKRTVKISAGVGGIVFLLTYLLYELFRLIF